MKIKSKWDKSVEICINGVTLSFNPGQIKEVPDDFNIKKLRYFEVVEEGTSAKKDKKQGGK